MVLYGGRQKIVYGRHVKKDRQRNRGKIKRKIDRNSKKERPDHKIKEKDRETLRKKEIKGTVS